MPAEGGHTRSHLDADGIQEAGHHPVVADDEQEFDDLGVLTGGREVRPRSVGDVDVRTDVVDGPEDAVVSWELAPGVDADVFMIDDRTTPDELAGFGDVATWNVIPAVASGQAVIGWRFLLSYCRADYARTFERLLEALRTADDTVV